MFYDIDSGILPHCYAVSFTLLKFLVFCLIEEKNYNHHHHQRGADQRIFSTDTDYTNFFRIVFNLRQANNSRHSNKIDIKLTTKFTK